MTRRSRISALLLILIVLLAIHLVRNGTIVIADAWKPWTPLRIVDAPNLLTGWKLLRASNDDALCIDVLEDSGFRFAALPDRQAAPGCHFRNVVQIDAMNVAATPFPLSCRAALSLAMWERHVLQPEARLWLGSEVVRIEHFGSYACRNIYGRANAARSRHATADALDIAGFVLDDGRRIRIVRDWRSRVPSLSASSASSSNNAGASSNTEALGADVPELSVEDAKEAGFLRAVHRGACRYFDAVLGPEYNAAHGDHFHLDRVGFRACR